MEIGLIAMSGIRAVDEDLLALGLTLPGFVERSETIASLPSLGLLTLAGMTPARHRCTYIEVDDIRDLDRLPGSFDLVAISSFSAQMGEAYELASRYREAGALVVVGGLHATSLPEETARRAPGVSVAAGEGELVWDRILADAENGALEPVYDARSLEFDLADAPMPAFELLDIERYNRLTVQTSRGCPWKCSFCASSILLTRRYKRKPIAKVLAEIDRIREIWPRPFLEFADDNAFVDRKYWRTLLPELARRDLRWFAETDLAIADDEELLEGLREAGCASVLIGFESPVAAGLDGIEMNSNWKRRQWPHYRDAIRKIQSYGIRVNACFVLGLDGHDAGVFDELFAFIEDAAPFDVQITYPTPFPGTPLYRRWKSEKRLTHDGEWNRLTLFDPVFEPRGMTQAELRAGFHALMKRLYNEDFNRFRRDAFREQYRAGRAAREAAPGPGTPGERGRRENVG